MKIYFRSKVQVMLMNRDRIGSIYVYYSTFVLFVLLVFDQVRFELGIYR